MKYCKACGFIFEDGEVCPKCLSEQVVSTQEDKDER